VPAGNQAPPACARRSAVSTAGEPAASAVTAAWVPGQPAGPGEDGPAAGASWRLPADASCASTARAHLRQALADLQLPGTLIDDAAVAVSELATNAWLHALDAKPVPGAAGACAVPLELWVYRRGRPPGAELVCGVFDARRDAWPRTRPNSFKLLPDDKELAGPLLDAILADNPGSGHGLGIVAGLSDVTGCHRTRSRLSAHSVPGKVAWFTMKIPSSSPAAQPPPVHLTPVQAARTLAALLTARGIPGITHHHGTRTQSMVSIQAGFTVQCRDGTFQWLADGGGQRAYSDLTDTLENIIRIHEDIASAGRPVSG